MKTFFKQIITLITKNIIPAIGITFVLILCTCNFACQSNLENLSFLNVEYESPSIKSFNATSSRDLIIRFSGQAEIKQCIVKPQSNPEEIINVSIYSLEEEGSYKIILDQPTVLAEKYMIEGCVIDKKGNSLTFDINFSGYNDHPAVLVLSEVRNAYSSKDKKAEFVELYVKESGNLYGLSLISAYDGDERKYSFLPVEVNKGEYITVHYRMIQDKDGNYIDEFMYDETQDNLALSRAVDSNDKARDFWINNNKAALGTSDILLLYNQNNDCVMDCLLWQPSDKTEWNNKYTEYLQKVEKSGIWHGDTLCSDGMTTVNRSLSRLNTEEIIYDDKYHNDAGQWIVACVTSRKKNETMIQGATPGSYNSKNAYIK